MLKVCVILDYIYYTDMEQIYIFLNSCIQLLYSLDARAAGRYCRGNIVYSLHAISRSCRQVQALSDEPTLLYRRLCH